MFAAQAPLSTDNFGLGDILDRSISPIDVADDGVHFHGFKNVANGFPIVRITSAS